MFFEQSHTFSFRLPSYHEGQPIVGTGIDLRFFILLILYSYFSTYYFTIFIFFNILLYSYFSTTHISIIDISIFIDISTIDISITNLHFHTHTHTRILYSYYSRNKYLLSKYYWITDRHIFSRAVLTSTIYNRLYFYIVVILLRRCVDF